MRIRPTARLLVIDDQQRLLLFQVQDSRPLHAAFPAMTLYWVTPGGGVEAGESYEQAAQRELWEETGITVAAVGACVWLHERVIDGDAGRIQLQERFFIVSVPTSVVDLAHMLPYEHETHRAYRWWTRQELLQSVDFFTPQRLPELIQPVLDGLIPTEPSQLLG